MKVGQTLYVTDRTAWRSWLATHHRTADEIWLVYYRKESGKPRIPYNDAVEEALCYGWIDNIVKPIDKERFAQRFSPRKPGSPLSAMNRERIRRLRAQGKMTRAGLDAVRHALTQSNRVARSESGKRVAIPSDIRKALQANEDAWRNFQRFPASYKRIRIGWIEGARKRAQEFQKRLRYFVKMTAQNKRFGMVQ